MKAAHSPSGLDDIDPVPPSTFSTMLVSTILVGRSVLVLGIIALLLAACGLAADEDEEFSATIRYGDGPFLSAGGYFIAKERGYFEQLGLTIEYEAFPDGAMVVAPLTAGEFDVGGFTASAGTFNARFQGAAFRVFMDRGQECPEQAYLGMNVSQELYDAGLTSLEDLHMLRGHRVGVGAPGSINQFTFARALEAAGLDPVNDVEWVEGVPQPDLVGMLGEGRVDATNLAWQLALAAENQGFGPNIITGGQVAPCAQIAFFVAHEDFIEENREALVRFAMAYLEGVREFNEALSDPEGHIETTEFLAENTFLEDAELIRSMAPHWAWLEPDGIPNVESIMEQQQYWREVWGIVEGEVSEEDLFDLTIVEEARERLAAENPFSS